MSNFYFEPIPNYLSGNNPYKANSHYLNKFYAQQQKERKKNRENKQNFLWGPIVIENLFENFEKNVEKVKKYQKSPLSSKQSSNLSKSNSFISDKENEQLNKSIPKNKNSGKQKNLKKLKKKSDENIDLSSFFQETDNTNNKNNIIKTERNSKLMKENNFELLNKTIDSFEKTLENFIEVKKEKKNRSLSNKSFESLKELQKSLTEIEENMEKKLKIMSAKQTKKTTAEILAENIAKQTVFTTNEDLYEISFQQKN